MAFTALTVTAGTNVSINGQGTAPGVGAKAPKYTATVVRPVLTLGTAAANAALGGANEVLFQQSTIAASGTLDIDLRAFTNFQNVAAASLVRVKYFLVRLLNQGDDPSLPANQVATQISVKPTASNGWGGAGMFLRTTTSEVGCYSGGKVEAVCPTAAGWPTTATTKGITITNLDATNSAVVQVLAIGGSN